MNHPKTDAFLTLVNRSVDDLNECFNKENRAAGRRARKTLQEIKKAIKPLRDDVMLIMKGKNKPVEKTG